MNRIALLSLLALVLAALPAPARAETVGEKALRLHDEANTRAKDQAFEYDVITQEPGKAKTTITMKVKVKKDKRFIEFTSPGDIKGMKVLVESLTQMYVYLPAYHKVRRVASHTRSQGFMGTALSQDDMSITTYLDVYAPKLIRETKAEWVLELIRRPGKTHPYPRVEMAVRKDNHHPAWISLFNDKGVKLKSEARSEYSCQPGNLCTARVMRMTDYTRNGLWTDLIRTAWKTNTGAPDGDFTPRALQTR
jgi:hypothetical protein